MAKILIIKLGALGDVVMATTLIRQIQLHHAGDELHVLTSPEYTGIFSSWHELTTSAFPRHGFVATIRTVCWIRKKNFDRVFDLQSNDRTRIYCALSSIPERVGNHPAYPYTIHPPIAYSGTCHIFTRMNEMLAAAGIAPAQENVYLPLHDEQKQGVLRWVQEQGLMDRPFVIMHAGASRRHPEKCWPYYEQLAVVLQDRGLTTVWIGGKDDKEANQSLAATCGIDACNLFTLNELAELARHARFAVTNDSGPMHALSGSGVPVYAFFGSTNWLRNHALGQAHNVITRQPADVRGKHLPQPEYQLHNISCDEVISRLDNDGMLV